VSKFQLAVLMPLVLAEALSVLLIVRSAEFGGPLEVLLWEVGQPVPPVLDATKFAGEFGLAMVLSLLVGLLALVFLSGAQAMNRTGRGLCAVSGLMLMSGGLALGLANSENVTQIRKLAQSSAEDEAPAAGPNAAEWKEGLPGNRRTTQVGMILLESGIVLLIPLILIGFSREQPRASHLEKRTACLLVFLLAGLVLCWSFAEIGRAARNMIQELSGPQMPAPHDLARHLTGLLNACGLASLGWGILGGTLLVFSLLLALPTAADKSPAWLEAPSK